MVASAYSSTSPPAWPGCPLASHPTTARSRLLRGKCKSLPLYYCFIVRHIARKASEALSRRDEFLSARSHPLEFPFLGRRSRSSPFLVSPPGHAGGTRVGDGLPFPPRADRLGLAGPRLGGGTWHTAGLPAPGAAAVVGFLAAVSGRRSWFSCCGQGGRRPVAELEGRLRPGSAAQGGTACLAYMSIASSLDTVLKGYLY
jgi:hypothetical protein